MAAEGVGVQQLTWKIEIRTFMFEPRDQSHKVETSQVLLKIPAAHRF